MKGGSGEKPGASGEGLILQLAFEERSSSLPDVLLNSLTMPTSWARFQHFAVNKTAGVVLQEKYEVLEVEVEVESGGREWK